MGEGPAASLGAFPDTRLRRLRRYEWSRRLVRETSLSTDDLIWPLFVCDGAGLRIAVPSMPGVERYSIDVLLEAVGEAQALGIPAVALFPVVEARLKTSACTEAWNPDNLLCRAVRAVRKAYPEIGVICDVALDPYNRDGHDGLVIDGEVANDPTLDALCRQALVQAEAGAQMLAPSDMMDGRIGRIRHALDGAGRQDVMLMSYAAKYASAFYGPFRDAVDSAAFLKGSGKETYQMDPANAEEALREVALDIAEGADLVMVKPGLAYLDVLWRIKSRFGVPVCAYSVSGEYAMLRFAAAAKAIDLDRAVIETLTAFKRAGADAILTYFARDAARLLRAR
jgi:porphobilinogen synthase